MNPECPQCISRDTVQINDRQAECLVCGEVFIHYAPAPELDEEAA